MIAYSIMPISIKILYLIMIILLIQQILIQNNKKKQYSNKIIPNHKQYLLMCTNTEYLDRLQTIRQKYGCSSHSKIPPYTSNQQHPPPNKTPIKDPHKIDPYILDRKKIYQPINITSMVTLPMRSSDYSPRIHNTMMGINVQPYIAGDYAKKIEREKDGEINRDNYQVQRKKNGQELSGRGLAREYFKEVGKSYNYQAGRQNRELGRDIYLRQRNPQLTTIFNKQPRNTYPDQPLRTEQAISPAKRVPDYDQKRNYRARQSQTPDIYNRPREVKLSEFTPSKLNQNKILNQDDLLYDPKLIGNKRNDPYTGGDTKKLFGYRNTTVDMENKLNDFSVSNIERIQQRIQSILGKK